MPLWSFLLGPVATLSSALRSSKLVWLQFSLRAADDPQGTAPSAQPKPACLCLHSSAAFSASILVWVEIVAVQSSQLVPEEELEAGAYFTMPSTFKFYTQLSY